MSVKIDGFRSLISVALLCVWCIGCAPHRIVDDSPGLPVQGVRSSERMIIALQKKMSQEGIRVITLGQNYLISIPSSVIFHNQSPEIKWGSYAVLNDVACYLQQFRKISININSFSSCYKSKHRAYALTLARARVLGDYLGSQGLDSRFIFTRGLGNGTYIVEHAKEDDFSPNSRIEITFRSAVL